MTTERPAEWWRTYFDRDFIRIYGPLLPPEDTGDAVEAILELTAASPGQRFLDAPCGWGRHAAGFADAGMEVTALDRSLALLEHGRAAGRSGDAVQWVCGDLRHLPFRPSFDVVTCLFSSLGYFESEEDDLLALREMKRVLAPDGILVIETVHRDGVVRNYAERDWWEGEDGEIVTVEREFDPIAGLTRERLRWIAPDGAAGEKVHVARIRSATEWRLLLEEAGLDAIGWYGGWLGESFSYTSDSLILLAMPAG